MDKEIELDEREAALQDRESVTKLSDSTTP
jgi:hypothetical protein